MKKKKSLKFSSGRNTQFSIGECFTLKCTIDSCKKKKKNKRKVTEKLILLAEAGKHKTEREEHIFFTLCSPWQFSECLCKLECEKYCSVFTQKVIMSLYVNSPQDSDCKEVQ